MYEALKEDLSEVADKVTIQGITLHVENPIKNLEAHRITPYTETLSTEHWFIVSIDSKEMIYECHHLKSVILLFIQMTPFIYTY